MNQDSNPERRSSPREGLNAPIRRAYRAQRLAQGLKISSPVMAALDMVENSAMPMPDLGEQPTHQRNGGWGVTIFNNDVNTYEEVIGILMSATGCTSEEAYIEAWEVDHYGTCLVHIAAEEECKSAAKMIATIGMRVEVGPLD